MCVDMRNIIAAGFSCMLYSTAFLSPACAQETDPALVEKGRYLSILGDCGACHRAADSSGQPFQGGYTISTPMGNIVAPNITPAKTVGIGDYTLEDFSNAVRKGIRKDGAHLYPGMPYPAFSRIRDEDIKALYSYFMLAVQPVEHMPQQETSLAFPFNIRELMIGWNILFGSGASIKLPDDATDQIKRGQYLVDGLGHCGTCHTPRNSFMAEDSGYYFSGGFADTWHAPNITSDLKSGIGSWSEDELASYLKGGYVPGKGGAAGVMAEAINVSLRNLDDSDIQAIAAYLKQVPAISNPGQTSAVDSYSGKPVNLAEIETGKAITPQQRTDSGTTDGALLFNNACAACHGLNGQGTNDHFYPSLTHNTTVGMDDPRNLISVIRGGVDRQDGDKHVFMPPASLQPLNDAQIIAIANYVRSNFGNGKDDVTQNTLKIIDKGIPTPFIIRNAVWLLIAGLAAAVIILAAILRLVFRKKSNTKQKIKKRKKR